MKNLSLIWFCFLSISLCGQQSVSGIIKDNGDFTPLNGANIQIKGMEHIGTSTDVEGKFNLLLSEKEAITLIISYLGYQTIEMPAEECNNATIFLTVTSTFLNEAVVVGYGTQVRSDITGNITKIKKDVIESTPVNSFESTLQGRAAGVFVSNNSGKLGQNVTVRIRGTNSINASAEPLYVIDGMIMNTQDQLSLNNPRLNPLADINFNDIESVTILKDAAATAIYGSKASNGVIIITTKKGLANATRITLDMNIGWSRPTRKRKWLNSKQYLELWDEAFVNVADSEGKVEGQTGQEWKDSYIPRWDEGNNTDWESLIYTPQAGQKQVQLNASGGNDKTTFYLSGGYSDQTAIVILNSFERISGRINLAHQASSKLDFGMNLSLTRTFSNLVHSDPNFASPVGLISQSPAQPVNNPEMPDELFDSDSTLYFHALHYIDNTEQSFTNYRTLGNVFLNWRPMKNLNFHTDFGMDLLDFTSANYFNSKVSGNTSEDFGHKTKYEGQALNYTINEYATYQIQAQQHHIEITAGMTFQELNESLVFVSGRNFPNDDFHNLSSAADIYDGGEQYSAFSSLSWFARTNYHYKQKYLLSLSSRIDGDSRFGKDNRFGFFPAVSLGWVISKESFFKSSFLSFLKIRTSWGVNGNTPIQHFPSQGLFVGRGYAGVSGIIQTQVPNPDLKWERTAQKNIGIDFGLFEDRLSGQIDYYIKNTNDLLLQANIPSTTGFASQIQNIGSLKNEGYEFLLDAYVLTGDLRWKTTLNFSKNKNTVTDIKNQIIKAANNNESFVNAVIEGQPIGVFYAPEFAGVNPDNGDAQYYLNTKLSNGELDRTTTNILSEAQSVVIGDPNPDFIYGWGNTLSWNGLQLSLLFQGVYGNEIFDAAGRFQQDGFGWFDNQDIRMLDRWQKPGDQTDIPQVRFLQGTFHSSRFIDNGSYIRLKNLSLNYKLPSKWVEEMGVKNVRIYSTGQNIWTITNYRGRDPEVNSDFSDFFDNGRIVSGMDFFTAPQAKTIIFGIKVEF